MTRLHSFILVESLFPALRAGDTQEADHRFHPHGTGSPGEKPHTCVTLVCLPKWIEDRGGSPEGIELIGYGFLEEVAFELDLMANDPLEVKMWCYRWREQGKTGCLSEERGVQQAVWDGKEGSTFRCSGVRLSAEDVTLLLPPSHCVLDLRAGETHRGSPTLPGAAVSMCDSV